MENAILQFIDQDNDKYVLAQMNIREPLMKLIYPRDKAEIYLYRSLVKEMLPYLITFVETGKLI